MNNKYLYSNASCFSVPNVNSIFHIFISKFFRLLQAGVVSLFLSARDSWGFLLAVSLGMLSDEWSSRSLRASVEPVSKRFKLKTSHAPLAGYT